MKARKCLALLLALMMLTGSAVAFAQESGQDYDINKVQDDPTNGTYDLSSYNPDFIFFKKGSNTVYVWFSSALTEAQKAQILLDAGTTKIDPSLAGSTPVEIVTGQAGIFLNKEEGGKITAEATFDGANVIITREGISHFTAGKIKKAEPTIGSLTVSKRIFIDGFTMDEVQQDHLEAFELPQTFEFELEKWDNSAWVETETTFSLTVAEDTLVPSIVLDGLDTSVLYRVVETTPTAPGGYTYVSTSYSDRGAGLYAKADGTAIVDVGNSYVTGSLEAGKGHVSVKKFLVDSKEMKPLLDSDIADYEITVTLHDATPGKGALQVGEAITLSAKNNWAGAWTNLEPGDYIVREKQPDHISDYIFYSGRETITSAAKAKGEKPWASPDAGVTVVEGETIEAEYTNIYNVTEKPPVDPEAKFSFIKSVSGLPVGTYTFGFKAEVEGDGELLSFNHFDEQGDLTFDLTVDVTADGATTFKLLEDDAVIARIENLLVDEYIIVITEIESSATRYATGDLRYNGMSVFYNGASQSAVNGFSFEIVPLDTDPDTEEVAHALMFHNAYASSSTPPPYDPPEYDPPIPLGAPVAEEEGEEIPLGPPMTGDMQMIFVGIALLIAGAVLLGVVFLKRAKQR